MVRLPYSSRRDTRQSGHGCRTDDASDARAALPTPVGYPGKPADRYWEFEDAKSRSAASTAAPVNLARMLLVEYALVFGNDWFVVPVDMPVGSLFRTTKFRVRDTFGVESLIGPSRNVDGPFVDDVAAQRTAGASLGAASAAPSFFFLPPVSGADVGERSGRGGRAVPRRDGEHGVGRRAARAGRDG